MAEVSLHAVPGRPVQPAPGPLIAFYLPQYHPIPENDEWWGPGFTEWRSTVTARPLFPGHYQPHIPADLGFYDLRVPETREAQADLARRYGIGGFCYFHYWFHGRRLLSRPFDEVLASGRPDLPFCLCWANEDWNRAWDGCSDSILVAQQYSDDDDLRHIRSLAPAFADERYLRVEGKPLFLVYRASKVADPLRTTTAWREEAARLGVGELFLCRVEGHAEDRGDPVPLGFDAAVEFQPDWLNMGPAQRGPRLVSEALRRLRRQPPGALRVHEYAELVERNLAKPAPGYRRFPCVAPGWDNTPRRGAGGLAIRGSTPELYERWLREILARAAAGSPGAPVFVNAWNEWAEGNHLEPDLRYGHAYLEATQRAAASVGSSAVMGSTPRG